MTGSQLRKLTSRESLRLQGFDDLKSRHPDLSDSTLLRMAGNAVPRPMGHFVIEAVSSCSRSDGMRTGFGILSASGVYDHGFVWSIEHTDSPLADNLIEFLDEGVDASLSNQAAAGLLVRSIRANQPMPVQLFDLLLNLAGSRRDLLKPSRSNSFDLLDGLSGEIANYRSSLNSIEDYSALEEEHDEV